VSDVAVRKQALRLAAREARAAAHAAEPQAPERVAAHVRVLAETLGRPPGIVSGYLPVRNELDPLPAMTALSAIGWRLALPVVVGPGLPLVFRAWAPGEPTVRAGFGLEVPAAEVEVVPDLLLVPLLAFDARGHRLGYGKGYYDRTLRTLRAAGAARRTIGLGFALQEPPEVPAAAFDEPLDAIVTEHGLRRCAPPESPASAGARPA
jgi:5-formyltetrahydrofolate cyclo-ligase